MRFTSTFLTFAAGVLFAAASATTGEAGGKRCVGPCYEEAPAPVYHRTLKRRVELEPGLYEIAREPSLYGTATRRVLLGGEVEWRERPAVYRSVKVRTRVGGGVRWEKRLINGRYVMCKVRVPRRTEWTERTVLVEPASRVRVRTGRTYGYEQRRVLLRPYKNIAVYHRARHRYVRERVTIQPEGSYWSPVSRHHGGW